MVKISENSLDEDDGFKVPLVLFKGANGSKGDGEVSVKPYVRKVSAKTLAN
jgi:hypothetical protein